ncbi:MAG TPA: zinc ribbon domain-containing protein, partial [Symbiobacteriaceae bacterium]|nr:zinc ribbon domain-containing protein [Symbiobacteriaceae bacterium]
VRNWTHLPGREYRDRVLGLIRQEGISTAVYRAILSDAPNRVTVCIVRREGAGTSEPEDVYDTCNEGGLAGMRYSEIYPVVFRLGKSAGPLVTAPDGKQYFLAMWDRARGWSGWLGLTAFVAVCGGWVCLALWVFADARWRGSRAALGWLLLGLMTGPLGLAVWLVVRREVPVETPHCPGCGADVVAGTMFCVRCGQPLHPACPECGRRVELDWAHCGACGASLGEGGGGDRGLLADENGA